LQHCSGPCGARPCRRRLAALSPCLPGRRTQVRGSGYVLLRNVVLAGGAGSSEVLDVAGSQGVYLEGTRVTGAALLLLPAAPAPVAGQ
jgi:hypothetical protein